MISLADIKYVLFGVQFNHSFKLLDYWGSIADDILYKSEYFNSEFFSQISTQYTTERSLSNPITGNVLTLSSNNLVFKYYIKDAKRFNEEYKWFCDRVNKYLVPEILTKYNLVVRRVGCVFSCEMSTNDLEIFSARYFKENLQGITDFRFAQKEVTKAGQLWHGVDDYINKIYTVGKIDDEKEYKGLTYDFQLYYKPLQADIRKKSSEFLKQALIYLKKDVIALETRENGA